MERKSDLKSRLIPKDARLAIYGTGQRGRTLVTLLAEERPDLRIRCMVDSFHRNPDATPPVARVDDLPGLVAEIDALILATAYEREILINHGGLIRRFPLYFFDDETIEKPRDLLEEAGGALHLSRDALARWDNLRRGFEDETATKEMMLKLANHTMVSYDGLMTLAELVRYVDREGIPGALAECGSWRGGSSALMAWAHMASGPTRELRVFDSFQGLPEPDGTNDDLPEAMLPPEERGVAFTGALRPIKSLEADKASNEEVIFDLVGYPRELVTFHEGWFQHSVPSAARDMGPIALLRLDGDLYESYRVCLEHLYPLVSPGGVVIIDDWCLEGCRKAVEEYFERIGERPFMRRIDAIARYMVKAGN